MITIKEVTDINFRPYGKVVEGIDIRDFMVILQDMPSPEDVVYIASVPELEQTKAAKAFEESFFGGMPIQVGVCNGKNKTLNALEYHRSSEINIALYDMILLLGRQQDVDDEYHYDTSKIEAFLVPANTAVELYATTLHYAPCNTEENGFKAIVILPKGTNESLKGKKVLTREDELLFAVNKWLIAHKDGNAGDDAFIGLDGGNICII